jgi:thiamine biosynthesis protein ThiC
VGIAIISEARDQIMSAVTIEVTTVPQRELFQIMTLVNQNVERIEDDV